VSGGVSKCGDKHIPSYFTRLNHPEIAEFIAAPELSDIQSTLGNIFWRQFKCPVKQISGKYFIFKLSLI